MAQLPKQHEHRWGERIAVNLPIQITTSAARAQGAWLQNVSLSGALLKAGSEMRLHTVVEITIELPAPAQRKAVVEAYVSRKREELVGVEWCQFAPSIVKELLRSPTLDTVEPAQPTPPSP
jgi:hypothetical protein